MPTYKVTAPDGRIVRLTGDSPPTDAELEEIFGNLPPAAKPQTAPTGPSALETAAGAASVPIAGRLAMGLATNPNVPRTAATIGRVVGGTAPIAAELYEGNIPGAIKSVIYSPAAAWAGGKTGWFGGKMLQSMARPVAQAAQAVQPVGHILGALSGAQGVGELAQMQEPQRKDIGVAGIGPSVHVPGEEPTVAERVQRFTARQWAKIRELMNQGASREEAARAIQP